MPELILALDVGTTNLTACIFTPAGQRLGQASAGLRTRSALPCQVEQDPTLIWQTARKVMTKALEACGHSLADMAAIGVTSQRTSVVFWDRKTGAALTQLVVWSDLRGADRAKALQAAGIGIVAQQAAAKLELMLAGIETGAALLASNRLAWGNIDSYLIFKLTGGAAHVTDRSQAWPTGYLDLASRAWNLDLMGFQGLDEAMFPTLVDSWGEMGRTDLKTLGASVPITAVIADQQAALIGQGCEAAGAGKITYGTSATVNVSTGKKFASVGPTLPPFLVSAVGEQVTYCIEGMVFSAGNALDWVRRNFGLGGHAAFARLTDKTQDSGGTYLLPAFQGLGAPHVDPTKAGVIGGLTLSTGPGQIARAAIEGIAYRVREVVDGIYDGSGLARPEVLRVDGGLTNNDALMQLQANVLGTPLARHSLREATACGAAICAARGVGLLGPEETAGFSSHDQIFEPGQDRAKADQDFATWKAQVYG